MTNLTDDLQRLADKVLDNLEDWRLEVKLMEPGPGRDNLCATYHGSGAAPIEDLLIKRDSLAEVVKAIDRRVRGMRPPLGQVFRLRYRSRLGVGEIVLKLGISPRTASRHLSQIRAMVGATLLNLSEENKVVQRLLQGQVRRGRASG